MLILHDFISPDINTEDFCAAVDFLSVHAGGWELDLIDEITEETFYSVVLKESTTLPIFNFPKGRQIRIRVTEAENSLTVYMNCVVGLVHKHLGDEMPRRLFAAWAGDTRQSTFDDLAWLALVKSDEKFLFQGFLHVPLILYRR